MSYQSFEDLNVWKKSSRLCVEIYKIFKYTNEFWLRDQVLRSALSIPSNIAGETHQITEKSYCKRD